MSIVSYSVSNFPRVQNTPSGRKAMLLEGKSLLRKKIPDQKAFKWVVKINLPGGKGNCVKRQILVKKKIYPAGNIVQTS